MIKGILLDFSGTIFDCRGIIKPARIASLCGKMGLNIDTVVAAQQCRDILIAADCDKGKQRREGCNISRELHNQVWRTIAVEDAGVNAILADVFVSELVNPNNWQPFGDTAPFLRQLFNAGLTICIVSNIAFDVRESCKSYGLANYINEYVLSYEYALSKPDREIFLLACEKIHSKPDQTLMIGDDELTDGKAKLCDIKTFILPSINGTIRGLNKVFDVFDIII